MNPQIKAFFDAATGTVTYVVHAGAGTDCAIIDSVLDYDPRSGRTSTTSADAVIAFVRMQHLNPVWLLETHAHADHLSAAPYLKQELGGRIAIGSHIAEVQQAFARVFPQAPGVRREFDHLIDPDEVLTIGALELHALHVPGHTPADLAYRIGDAVFVGDTCLLYTSPSPRDGLLSRMPSSA